MSEHAGSHEHEHGETANQPELTLVESHRYPDIQFELPKKSYVTTGVVDATDHSRYLHSVRLIDEVVQADNNAAHLDNQRRRTINYLAQTVNGPNGTRMRRHNTINQAGVVNYMLGELDEFNHPVTQLLGQFRAKFSETLGDHVVIKHASDLLIHYFPKTYYELAKADYQAQSSSGKTD